MSDRRGLVTRIRELEGTVKVGLVLSLFVLGIPGWMVWIRSRELQEVRAKIQATQKRAMQVDAELRSLKRLAARKDELMLKLEGGGALSGFSESLCVFGKTHNVIVSTMRAKDEPRAVGLRSGLNVSEQAFTGTCQGKYADLLNFFADIARSRQIMWLDSLEMTRAFGSESTTLQVKFSGRVWKAAAK